MVTAKVFAHKFVYRTLELTTVDLLRKVERPNPRPPKKEVLTAEERQQLLDCFDRDTFEDLRDRALMATFRATGLRFDAVHSLPLSSYDRVTGEFTVREKGDVVRQARLSPRAMKYLREYLGRRPRTAETDQLWTTDQGRPLSYWGGQMVVRRARERSGIRRLHAHLFRHGMGQHAADRGLGSATSRPCRATRRRPWPAATRARRSTARGRG